MNILFKINNKEIKDIDTTILFTKDFNYNLDAINLLNNQCEVITKNNYSNLKDIPNELIKRFNCEYLINKETLTNIDELKINILNSILTRKKVVVFLNILTFIDNEFKNNIIKYLKENNKRLINYTSEIEETLFLDYIFVVQKDNIIMEGTTKSILAEEKIIKKLGFNLPFIVELSNGLKYYGLIDKTYYDNESLVNELWK